MTLADPAGVAPTILDALGKSHAGFLHARGEAATDILIDRLGCAPRDAVLDFGCGTGATLVKFAARFPELALSGFDASRVMLAAARSRLAFCALAHRVTLRHADRADSLPFADHSFDKLYGESVLAILPDPAAGAVLAELRRVLRPGGTACFNETIWRGGTSAAEIERINRYGHEHFGIIQSGASRPTVRAWESFFAAGGFSVVSAEPLDAVGAPAATHRFQERLSRLFTITGRLRARMSPQLRRRSQEFRLAARALCVEEGTMEGILFLLRRDP